jgi:hypothetical protein
MEALAARPEHADDEESLAGRVALVTGHARHRRRHLAPAGASRRGGRRWVLVGSRARRGVPRHDPERRRGGERSPGQRRRSGRLPARRRRGDRAGWPARHLRQQRRRHRGPADLEHDGRRLAQGAARHLSGAFYMSKPALEHMIDARGASSTSRRSRARSPTSGRPITLPRSPACSGSRRRSPARPRSRRPRRTGSPPTASASRQRSDAGADGDRDDGGRAREGDRVVQDGDSGAPLGPPEEIARVVAVLAADASAYITGQVWGVNGGLDM